MRLIFSWAVLHSGSSNPKLIMLKIPPTNIYWVFSMLCTGLYQTMCSILRETKLSQLIFPLTKGLRHIVEIPPIFFLRYFEWPLGGSDVLEQTFVTDGMISFPPSLLHTVVETARPYGWTRLAMVHQSVFHLDLFSFNPRLAGHFFFIPPSRFDLMISSLIFGWLRVLSVLSASQDWSVRALDDVRERSFDHTFNLSELEEVPVDNHSKRHSFRFCSPLKNLRKIYLRIVTKHTSVHQTNSVHLWGSREG